MRAQNFTILQLLAHCRLSLNFSQDARLQQIIESGDMEQLAEIVLNGEGGRLLNLKCKEPEIQAFLNNVPSYMVCISLPFNQYNLKNNQTKT